jgi:TolB-like protein/Tfp pilus assembly protein PilF
MKCSVCGNENPDDSRFCGSCGKALVETPATPPAATTQEIGSAASVDFLPGQHLGTRYQIVEEIGRGGMGVVYKAIDKELGRIVALKMIRPELSSDPRMIEQFKQELILASEISQENVIRIHDMGEAQGIKYISMKYIDGTSLSDLIQATGRLTLEKAIGIAMQVCAALTAAHKRGVVHRDLKPQNIMINRNGDAHVMDFGIATSLTAKQALPDGRIIGTPDYISPEQAQGRGGDERSDIYSLGCIIYEMTTGKKPYGAESVDGLLRQHISEAPPLPSVTNPRLPNSLDTVVLKAMEKEAGKRFQSAQELCTALQPVAKDVSMQSTDSMVAQPATKAEASIAVLPFRDMSPEKDQEYFCDGMAEEIINALVRIEGLRVAALTSAFQFKDKGLDIRTIGEQLNVGAVLEGSVRKAGSRLRVTAQLVKVADGYHVWSERYDRDMEDVFAIQDDISQAIVKALEPKLVDKKARPAAQRTTNLEAYNLYLKGRYHWNKRTAAEVSKAIEYFNRALEADTDYALAHAGLADSYIFLEQLPPKEAYARARAAATKALQLDSSLAEPHTTLAWVACNADFDWETCEREFKLSIQMNPNYPTAHQWYGIFLAGMGRFDEALSELEVARQLDPLSLIIKASSGWCSQIARQYDRAIEEVRSVLEMDPTFMVAHSILELIYGILGMEQQDVEELKTMFRHLGFQDVSAAIDKAFTESGYGRVLEIMVDEFSSGRVLGPYAHRWAAIYLVRLGRLEEALDCLEQAYENREQEIPLIGVQPEYDALRSHPRFQDLLRRMGLDPKRLWAKS